MIDVTNKLNMYRECARSIWNNYFFSQLPHEARYDIAEEFEGICRKIFFSLVLLPLGHRENNQGNLSGGNLAIDQLIVMPSEEFGVPISINREMNESGYWDYPVNFVKPSDVDLIFINCFDFGILSFRDFEYYKVKITNSILDNNLVGRHALIKARYAKVFFNTTI